MSERMVRQGGDGAGVEWLERVEAMVAGEAGGSDARWKLTAGCDGRAKAGGAGMAEWKTSEEQSRGEGRMPAVRSRWALTLMRLWG